MADPFIAGCGAVSTISDVFFLKGDLRLAKSLPVSFQTLSCGVYALWPAQEKDIAAPCINEVSYTGISGLLVVNIDAGSVKSLDFRSSRTIGIPL